MWNVQSTHALTQSVKAAVGCGFLRPHSLVRLLHLYVILRLRLKSLCVDLPWQTCRV